MRRALASLLVGLGLLLSLSGSPAAADQGDPGPLVIVFDTSGSMNDTARDGTVKLSAAKKSMSDMVYSMSNSTQGLGLWTYPGGAMVDGCAAGEWVRDLSPENRPDATDVQAEIGLLSADGGTPTGPALRAAVESLRLKQIDSATIVLVSDGEANCGPPACEVAQEIVNSGFALTVASVAFDIADSASGSADLECVANVTGGSYSTADDTAELIDQLADHQAKDLELAVDIPSVVRAGEVVQVTATVTNPSRTPVQGASLLLTFDDPDIAAHIPAPQRRLPTIEPGASISRTWVLTTRSDARGGKQWRVLAGSVSGSVLAKGTLAITDKHLIRDDGGELLEDHGGTVLILGDSYSSGEGIADYVDNDYVSPDGKIRCHRSESAYGAVIGGDRSTVIACSGAVSYDLDHVKVGASDQLSMLAMEFRPDIVFLTIGGNDIGFSSIVEQCFLGDCSEDQAMHLARVKRKKGWAETYERVAQIVNDPARLEHRGGRPVPVVVSPYPDPLWEVTRGSCNAGTELWDWFRNGVSLGIIRTFKAEEATDIGFSTRDIATGKAILTELNKKVEDSVTEAQDKGYPVYYAATTTRFALGHSICEGDSYFVRLDPKSVVWRTPQGDSARNELFHPNKEGHAAWADALITWSQGQKADPDLVAPQPLGPVQKPFVPSIWRPQAQITPTLERPVNLQYPPYLDTYRLVPGSSVDLRIDGLAPGSKVLITVYSSPIALGELVVDEEGAASGAFTLPALPSGGHQLVVEGYNENHELVGTAISLTIWSGLPWPLVVAMGVCVISAVTAVVTGLVARSRRRAVSEGR